MITTIRALLFLVVVVPMLPAHATSLKASCRAYYKKQGLRSYGYHFRYVGNKDGYYASCFRTSDGGYVVVGTRQIKKTKRYRPRNSRGYMVKLDAGWNKQWDRSFTRRGFMDYEGASGVQTADGGYLVMVLAYVKPSLNGVTWISKVDRKGKVEWSKLLRGRGTHGTPCPQSFQLKPDGGTEMKGHIYPDRKAWRSERAYNWSGKIDGKGKLLYDREGGPLKK